MHARLTLRAEAEDAGDRLDAVIARRSTLSRARAQTAIDRGLVTLNGAVAARASARVAEGAAIEVVLEPQPPSSAAPQEIPLDVVYEDEHVVVVNKPAGLVVHPAPGHPDGTLVNALLHHCDDLEGVGDAARPGIVHRIDKDTSGLLAVTKTNLAHEVLAAQFAAHTVDREYVALCARVSGPGLADAGTFRTRHGRHPVDRMRFTGARGERAAVTHYTVEQRFADGALLVRCTLETGRTHQIRMHLAEAGAPLLGDPLYAPAPVANTRLIDRLALHARTLGFTHVDGRRLRFEAPLPDDMASALEKLARGVSWRT